MSLLLLLTASPGGSGPTPTFAVVYFDMPFELSCIIYHNDHFPVNVTRGARLTLDRSAWIALTRGTVADN